MERVYIQPQNPTYIKLNLISIWRGTKLQIFTKIGTKLRLIKIKGPNWD